MIRIRTIAIASWLSAGCAGDEALGAGNDAVDTGDATHSDATATGAAATATAGNADTATGDGTDHGAEPVTGDMSGSDGASHTTDAASTGDASRPGPVETCLWSDFDAPVSVGADYDQFEVVPGSHCLGTDHQDIDGIERVVFLGDSITVGTPPELAYYRGQLADALAERFDLQFGLGAVGSLVWKQPNATTGQALVIESGDFAACATWGAENGDLLEGGMQIAQCFAPEDLQARTLVVMTSGGNDLAAIAEAAVAGAPTEELWARAEQAVQAHRDAIEWLVAPGRFEHGVLVAFANVYEFTDGTGDVQSCPAAPLAGFDQPLPDPAALVDIVVWIEQEYARTAVQTGTDMIFLFEEFCGHGFRAGDPTAPCYRGPGTATWFDATCIHPTAAGHERIAEMFTAVIDE